jgi:hypothetical protein
MDETMLPDVWSMPVAGATKNLAALISFVLGGPGRFGRIYDSRQPHRRRRRAGWGPLNGGRLRARGGPARDRG